MYYLKDKIALILSKYFNWDIQTCTDCNIPLITKKWKKYNFCKNCLPKL